MKDESGNIPQPRKVSGKLILVIIILGLGLLYLIFFPLSRIDPVMLPDRICVLQDSLEASFEDQLGQDISQTQFEDNICVLYFYETGCEDTACQQVMNELSRIQTEYIDDQEVKIFAIALKDEIHGLERKQRIARAYNAIPEKWYILDTDTAGLKELYYEQLALPWSNDDSSVLNPKGMIVLGSFRRV